MSGMGIKAVQQRQPGMPDLRVISAAQLLLHEQHDAQRTEPLLRRLQCDGVLKNPPIVAPIRGEQRYVVLDGANRVTAMQVLGIAHIAVQVVDYEDAELSLDTWHHLISGVVADRVRGMLRALKSVQIDVADAAHARAQLARREVLAFVEYLDGEVWTLQASGDLHQRSQRLNEIVDLYKGQARVARQRPLAVLNGGASLSEKSAWLADWLAQQQASRAVRYYHESTFLFDE